MQDGSMLVWGMLFSVIGLGFFSYGRKQKAITPLITGITLFIFPYFMSNLSALLIVGFVLMAIPYFVKL